MNIENLKKLKAWLDDGAPHVVFNMEYGVVPISDINDQEDFLSIPEIERNKPGIGDCGTVCCIAGASYLMSRHLIDSEKRTRRRMGGCGVSRAFLARAQK